MTNVRVPCLPVKFSFAEKDLYHNESWELMIRRWSKLLKDFKLKTGLFDISKIPDIYDCTKYDLQHNNKVINAEELGALHTLSKAMADIVIPQVILAVTACICSQWSSIGVCC